MSRVRVGVEKDAAGSGQMSRGRKQQVSGEIPASHMQSAGRGQGTKNWECQHHQLREPLVGCKAEQ